MGRFLRYDVAGIVNGVGVLRTGRLQFYLLGFRLNLLGTFQLDRQLLGVAYCIDQLQEGLTCLGFCLGMSTASTGTIRSPRYFENITCAQYDGEP